MCVCVCVRVCVDVQVSGYEWESACVSGCADEISVGTCRWNMAFSSSGMTPSQVAPRSTRGQVQGVHEDMQDSPLCRDRQCSHPPPPHLPPHSWHVHYATKVLNPAAGYAYVRTPSLVCASDRRKKMFQHTRTYLHAGSRALTLSLTARTSVQ